MYHVRQREAAALSVWRSGDIGLKTAEEIEKA
jgi:hypothetical protein